jgi:hypothetical protein
MVAHHSEQVSTYKRTIFQQYTATFIDVGCGYLLVIPSSWSTSHSLARLGGADGGGGANRAGGGELAGAWPGAEAGLIGCYGKTCMLQSTSGVVVAIVAVVAVAAMGARRNSTSRGGGARV